MRPPSSNGKKEPRLIELLEPDDDKEDGEGENEAQEHHTARQNCRVHVHLRYSVKKLKRDLELCSKGSLDRLRLQSKE